MAEFKVKVLKDIVVPKRFYSRLDTGVPVLNEIFGGQEMPGILEGTVFLFTGMPGSGKSTMALQLSDLLQKNAKKNVLYNVGEENEFMTKIRADRLKLSGNFCISKFEQIDDLLMFCIENGVEVLVQDSLQSLKDGDLEGRDLLKSIVKKMQAWSKLDDDRMVTVFIIGHITKGGTFAGPMEIKHDVDAHCHLRLNNDTGNRVFELLKNRFGPATIPYEFTLNADGVNFNLVTQAVEPGEEGHETPGAATRAADRRDRIKNQIKEALLKGERVSGYCFTRFNADCSGGFWRAMLEKACQELQNEGHKIGDERVNGRRHCFVEV